MTTVRTLWEVVVYYRWGEGCNDCWQLADLCLRLPRRVGVATATRGTCLRDAVETGDPIGPANLPLTMLCSALWPPE